MIRTQKYLYVLIACLALLTPYSSASAKPHPEEMKNSDLRKLEKKCEMQNLEACTQTLEVLFAKHRFLKHKLSKHDLQDIAERYWLAHKYACLSGSGHSCSVAARSRAYGHQIMDGTKYPLKPGNASAEKLYEIGCGLNHAGSCANAGQKEKACELGYAYNCPDPNPPTESKYADKQPYYKTVAYKFNAKGEPSYTAQQCAKSYDDLRARLNADETSLTDPEKDWVHNYQHTSYGMKDFVCSKLNTSRMGGARITPRQRAIEQQKPPAPIVNTASASPAASKQATTYPALPQYLCPAQSYPNCDYWHIPVLNNIGASKPKMARTLEYYSWYCLHPDSRGARACFETSNLITRLYRDDLSALKSAKIFAQMSCDGNYKWGCQRVFYLEDQIKSFYNTPQETGGFGQFLADLGKGMAAANRMAAETAMSSPPAYSPSLSSSRSPSNSAQDWRNFNNAVRATNNIGTGYNSNCSASNPYC